MSNKRLPLGEFEELVLLAVAYLGNKGYGVSIYDTIGTVANRQTSLGAIYATLDRLEQKGMVSSWQGEATPERGGKAKRYYRLEGPGIQALQEAEHARALLRPSQNPAFEASGAVI